MRSAKIEAVFQVASGLYNKFLYIRVDTVSNSPGANQKAQCNSTLANPNKHNGMNALTTAEYSKKNAPEVAIFPFELVLDQTLNNQQVSKLLTAPATGSIGERKEDIMSLKSLFVAALVGLTCLLSGCVHSGGAPWHPDRPDWVGRS